MKHFFLFSLLVFASAGIYSQSITWKHWSFGINAEPGIGYRVLNTTGDASTDSTVQIFNDNEIPVFTWSGGVQAIYRLSDAYSLEAGVNYANRGFQQNYTPVYHIEIFTDSIFPDYSKYRSRFSYLTIPLMLNYSPGHKRLRFTGSIGFSVDYLLNYRETYYYKYADGHVTSVPSEATYGDLRKFNVSPFVVAGVSYRISDHFEVKLEPAFTFSVMSPNPDETSIVMHFWNAGLHAEVNYGW